MTYVQVLKRRWEIIKLLNIIIGQIELLKEREIFEFTDFFAEQVTTQVKLSKIFEELDIFYFLQLSV